MAGAIPCNLVLTLDWSKGALSEEFRLYFRYPDSSGVGCAGVELPDQEL